LPSIRLGQPEFFHSFWLVGRGNAGGKRFQASGFRISHFAFDLQLSHGAIVKNILTAFPVGGWVVLVLDAFWVGLALAYIAK